MFSVHTWFARVTRTVLDPALSVSPPPQADRPRAAATASEVPITD